MKKIYSTIMWLTVVCIGLWLIPWIYNFIFVSSYNPHVILYSPIKKEFIGWKYENDKKVYYDCNANKLNITNADSLFPLYYHRQLTVKGIMPDSINGVAINIAEVPKWHFMFKYTPILFNKKELPLYILMESDSEQVDLKYPSDVFRFTENRIEFIDMKSNKVREAKSRLFGDMLAKNGFTYPLKDIAGNQSINKNYDNGYLLLDNAGKMFHLKQIKGRPYVKKIDMPEGLTVKDFVVTEFKSMRVLGFVFDTDNKIWVLHAADYTFHSLDVDSYDCSKHNLQILGTILNWTVSIRDNNSTTIYAFTNDGYKLLKKHTIEQEERLVDKIGRFILPIKLKFSSTADNEIYPRFEITTN